MMDKIVHFFLGGGVGGWGGFGYFHSLNGFDQL